MPAPPIRIRIGASLDSSVSKAFDTVENRATRAAQNTQRAQIKAAQAVQKETQRIGDAWTKAAGVTEKASRRMRDDQVAAWVEIGKVAERELNRQSKVVLRETQRQQRIVEEFARRQGESFARRASHGAARFLTPYAPLASMARRTAGDLARGFGVDLNVGSSVQRNVSLESASVGLAQQERIATGGTTAGAKHYAGIARNAGDQLGVAPTEIVELMRAFTGRTGEFGKIEEAVRRLAPEAIASGTSLKDMGDAAGFFYNQVKDLPDALELTEKGMRAIIGQTAVGAVEMPDFARQMGRIAANARKFQGDRVTTISQSSALAQLAIESGGATSAADAARSVAAFANTFGKSARINAFKKHGVDLFTDKSQTLMRDQFDIIKESLVNTKGNIPDMASMFADTLGRKPVTALANAYTAAGGGGMEGPGIKAVDAMLGKYMKTMLTADAQQKNLGDHMAKTESKAQLFQNSFDRVVQQSQERLLPALQKLEPAALKFAEVIGNLATWAVDNPKSAIASAIGLSIARAGIESTLRSGIERVLLGAQGQRADMVGKVAGTAGAAMAIASLAVGTIQVGKMVISEMIDRDAEKQRENIRQGMEGANDLQRARGLAASGKTAEAVEATKSAIAHDTASAAGLNESLQDKATPWVRAIADVILGSGEGIGGIRKMTGTTDEEITDATRARSAAERSSLKNVEAHNAEAVALLRQLNAQLASGIVTRDETGRANAL